MWKKKPLRRGFRAAATGTGMELTDIRAPWHHQVVHLDDNTFTFCSTTCHRLQSLCQTTPSSTPVSAANEDASSRRTGTPVELQHHPDYTEKRSNHRFFMDRDACKIMAADLPSQAEKLFRLLRALKGNTLTDLHVSTSETWEEKRDRINLSDLHCSSY